MVPTDPPTGNQFRRRPRPRPRAAGPYRRTPGAGRVALALVATLGVLTSACSLASDDPGPGDAALEDLDGPTSTDPSTPETLQATIGDGGDDNGDDTAGDGDGDGLASSDGTATPPGFCDEAAPTEIRFQPGGTSAVVDNPASADQQDLFRLAVGDDQILTVVLDSTDGDARATLVTPAGTESDAFTDRVVAPTDAGSYAICVAAGPTGADYRLTITVIDDNTPTRVDAPWCGDTVNDRGAIRFAAGGFSGTVDGAVLAAERDRYTIEAAAGQDIDLLLVSAEANAVFDLRSPSGEILIDEVADFRIPLPEDGVYEICVGSSRGNATYVLDVSIA